MRQIRFSVFETNSSSVHSLCISKKPWVPPKKRVEFYLGDYEWGFGSANPVSYLYTAIVDNPEALDRLKEILDKHGIKYHFQMKDSDDLWLGIDHGEEAEWIAERILEDEDQTLRFLFSPESIVYTGNDNSESDGRCYAGDPEFYDCDKGEYIPNPHHDSEHFEYYMKGN